MNKQATYVLKLDGEISSLQGKLKTIQTAFDKMGGDKDNGIAKTLNIIDGALGKLREKANNPIVTEATFGSLLRDSGAITARLKELESVLDSVAAASEKERFEFLSPETQNRIKSITGALKTYDDALNQTIVKTEEQTKAEKELSSVLAEKTKVEGQISKNNKILSAAEKTIKATKEEIEVIKQRMDALGEEESLRKKVNEARAAAQKIGQGEAVEGYDTKTIADIEASWAAYEKEKTALEEKNTALKIATQTQEKYSKLVSQDTLKLEGLTEQYNELNNKIKNYEKVSKSNSTKAKNAAWKELRETAERLGVSMEGIPLKRTEAGANELKARLEALKQEGFSELTTQIEQTKAAMAEMNGVNDRTADRIREENELYNEQKKVMADREALLSRIKGFLGLQGAANLARRAVSDSIEAIRELDAVMTEMAMVTEADISNYWEQMEDHTIRAGELGVAIKDVYEAETLYYQQGLKTNEVIALSNQTLKMARIAGLSAEDATNKMTAALRGFNMELNETSAQNVADVYSELAAITAADVGQISNAMSKTASIAHSAGMEFETTAAFLAQIIETTQESAETAGTALKTVIARFQELKKDPAEIGEVDGEIIDANAIETALRSVGVSLRDASGQFRDLDDVFLELSSKWSSLDKNTQRYIATIAAGSRQQSRFIAMMSDYGRTQELVSAANSSSGASQEQFGKTLESLESKLEKLHNAWTTFTTGLLNQDVLKFGIDLLTKILEFINKITKGFGGLTGTISKLGLLVGAFKLGQKLLSKFSNTFVNTFRKAGAAAGEALVESWRKGLGQIENESATAGEKITKGAKSKDYSSKSRIAEDGHIKGFREFQTADLRRNKSNKLVRQSTEAAFTGAKQGESMTAVLSETDTEDKKGRAKARVKKGFNYGKKGKSLGSMGFTEAFDETAIKAIESQFKKSFTEITGDIDRASYAWEEFEGEMSSLDALSGLEQLDQKLESIGAKKLMVTQGIQDSIITSAHEKTATAQVRSTTSEAISNAGENTSLKSAISDTTVSSGLHAGQSLENQSFTTAFGPETIKAIEAQFTASVRSMTGSTDQATAAWREFENEMGTLDAATGLEQLDTKLAKIAATADSTKTKITQISVGSGNNSIGAAAQRDAVKPTVRERVGEAITEHTPISKMSQTSGLKKANKAIADNRGKSTKETLKAQKISFKLDGNTLNAIEKQFKQKMKAMSDSSKSAKLSIEDINNAWTKLENNIKDKDVVSGLYQVDAALQDTAAKTETAAEGMNEITNSSEVAGATGEDALEGQQATLESVSNAASTVGGGLMGVGAAFGFIGEMFRSLGLDVVADAFDTVGQIIMFVGGALMLLPPIISIINLALSTPPVGIILLIIGAVIIGLTLIIALISAIAKSNSTAEQLNKASEAAEEARENAQAAKKEFEELLESKDAYNGLVKTIDGLTEGTRAWKEAVAELNELVTQLITKYPQLAQYINWDKGYLDVSAEGWDYLIEQQQQVVSNAAAIAAQKQLTVQSFKKTEAEKDVTKATDDLVNKNSAYKNQVEAINKLVKEGKYGTEEYYEKINALQKQISKDGIAGAQESFNSYSRILGNYNDELKNYSKAEVEILRHAGSAKAQASKNYNNMIQSLEGQYSTIYSDAQKQVATDTASMYTNSNDGTNDKLKEMLKEEGLSSTGDEKLDMAALLKARTGEEVTADEISEMGKEADDTLAKKVRESYTVEAMGGVVDELYDLSLDNQKVADLYTGDLDIELISEDEIAALENTSTVVKNALKKQKEIIEQGRKDIDLELTKIYGKKQADGTNSEIKATEFFGSYKNAKRSIEQMQAILRGPGAEVVASYQEMIKGMSVEDRVEFVDYFEDVDWSSAIHGAKALKEASESASGEISIFGQSTLELADSFYSATNQANEFYRSLNSEALDELMEDGKISALEIMELSKANEDLAIMMENTGASASTLGRYYELLEDGTLTAASATGDFLKVLEKLRGAANTIEDSFAFLDTWEPSRSSTEISDSYSEMRDEMLELYNSGAFGDQALQDYIEQFVGKETWQKVLKEHNNDVSSAMKQIMEQVKSFEGNFKSIWQSLAESGSITGLSQGEDGSILFNFEEIADVETLKQQIMTQGWSEEMADALIADAQTFGENIEEGLSGVDIDEAFIEWLKTSVISSGGVKVLDKGQFDAFIKDSGMDPDTLEQLLADYGIQVGAALDKQGNLQAWIKEAILKDVKENKKFDLGSTYELLVSMGLTTEEAESQIAALAEEMQGVEFTLDGQTVKAAGKSLTEMTYDSHNYGSTAGLLEASRNKKVKLEQKKVALEQGRMTAEAMTIANVAAANIGAQKMAANLDAIAKFFGIKTSFFSDQAEGNTQDQINMALKTVNSSFTNIENELDKEMKALGNTDEDVDAEGILKEYKDLDANKSTPTTGVAYGDVDLVTKESEKVAIEYDWIYNYNEQINRILRERNKIEREYTKLLEDQNSSATDIYETTKKQLETYKEQAEYETAAIGRALTEIENIFADGENSKYTKYMKYNAENNTLTLDDEGLKNANFSEEEMEKLNGIAADVTKYKEIITDSQENLEEIEDGVKELKNRGRDSTSELYDVIKEGMVKERQDEIDALQNINDTIQTAEDKLLNKIQEQIDDARQAREEEKAREALADQQSYLTYLQGSSSGSNQLEAQQLQKDIEQSKEDLVNARIDQSLANMAESSANAAEQRQRQIDIAQLQLDQYASSALIWEDVKNVLYASLVDAQAANDFATAWAQTDAAVYWAMVKDTESLNPIAAEDMAKEFAENGKLAAVWSGIATLSSEEAQNLRTTGVAAAQSIESYIAGVNKAGPIHSMATSLLTDLGGKEGAINKTKEAIGILGNDLIGSDKKENILGNASANAQAIVSAIGNLKPTTSPNPSTSGGGSSGGTKGSSDVSPSHSGESHGGKSTSDGGSGNGGGNDGNSRASELEIATNASWIADYWSKEDLKDDVNESGYITVDDTDYYVKAMGDNNPTVASQGYDLGAKAGEVLRYRGVYYLYVDSTTARQLGKSDDWLFKTNSLQEGYNKFTAALAFKTGGLADFTGPAWLDGTKSHPELVLNAQDTQNFIQLKDILAEVMEGTKHSSSNSKNAHSSVNTFDIDINVESLGSDYEVEELANKIRSMLYNDATYRNVNNINRTR